MIVDIKFQFDMSNKLFELIEELPKPFYPTYFSDSEGVVNKQNDLYEDKERFLKFRVANPLGFFLYCPSCTIDIDFNEDETCNLFIEITKKVSYSKAFDLIKVFLSISPVYAFACDWEEYVARNKLFKQFDNYSLEAFVGRDADKYLPGLYWGNLLSRALMEHHSISIENITKHAYLAKELNNDYFWVQMYENSGNWKENCNRIDDICNSLDNVFSKKAVFDQVASIEDREAYDKFLDQWP